MVFYYFLDFKILCDIKILDFCDMYFIIVFFCLICIVVFCFIFFDIVIKMFFKDFCIKNLISICVLIIKLKIDLEN